LLLVVAIMAWENGVRQIKTRRPEQASNASADPGPIHRGRCC